MRVDLSRHQAFHQIFNAALALLLELPAQNFFRRLQESLFGNLLLALTQLAAVM